MGQSAAEARALMADHMGAVRAVVAGAPPLPDGAVVLLRACGFPGRSVAARSGLVSVSSEVELSTVDASGSSCVESSAARPVARGAESSSPRGPENVAHGQVAAVSAADKTRRAS